MVLLRTVVIARDRHTRALGFSGKEKRKKKGEKGEKKEKNCNHIPAGPGFTEFGVPW